MFYILAFAVVACLWFLIRRNTTERGKRFVKAANFLDNLDCGSSVVEANELSDELFTNILSADIEEQIIHRAIRAKDLHFNGKQLPLIRLAASKGFMG